MRAVLENHAAARRRMQKQASLTLVQGQSPKRFPVDVRYFVLLFVDGERCYLALGKHHVFILKANGLQIEYWPGHDAIPYSSIIEIILDPEDSLLFAFRTSDGVCGALYGTDEQRLTYLQSPMRKEVVQNLTVRHYRILINH